MVQLYSGDLSSQNAWELLKANPDSVLVDVRTAVEQHYVGVPELRPLGKELISIEWRSFPRMERNSHFFETLRKHVPNFETPIIFLCRTGGRSQEAAIEMTAMGYKTCYNLESGFDGDLDPKGQRGKISGWKASGLNWRQD